VLRERKGAIDERERPNGRFLPRAIQLVVELGVLELRERQRQRLVQNQQIHTLREQHAQQRLTKPDAATSTPSSATSSSTRAEPSAAPARFKSIAATTASTMSLPMYAMPAGMRPAAIVRAPSAIVSVRCVDQTSAIARRL